jgi:chemotaxis protein CheC
MDSKALTRWSELVSKGTVNAMSGLSDMIGQQITVKSLALKRVPVTEIPSIGGGPEVSSVGIYLASLGAADGHILLMLDPGIAYAFVDLLMGQPPRTTQSLGEMERSALGEMGNIIGSFFLNALADSTGLDLRPSPPAVLIDMAGAVMDVVVADMMLRQEYAFVAETAFHAGDADISGQFFVMPSEQLLQVLLDGELVT